MRVTRIDRLEAFWHEHPDAQRALLGWLRVARGATLKKPLDVKNTLRSADIAVRVSSGRSVVVFDVRGNEYRLVASIDYQADIVHVLHVMTHAEYDREKWKQLL